MLRLALALAVLSLPAVLAQDAAALRRGLSSGALPPGGGSLPEDAPTVRAVDDGSEAEYRFEPARVVAAAGARVTVVGGTNEPHTVSEKAPTPDARRFDSGNVDPGATGSFTAPAQPGEYAFLCIYHPGMTGTLVVQGAAANATTTTTPPTATTQETPFPAWAALVALPLAGLFLARRRA